MSGVVSKFETKRRNGTATFTCHSWVWEVPMSVHNNSEEPFYFGEVIGSAMSYHQPDCHIIRLIRRRNYKRLRNWEEAVSLGLNPCPHCRPPFIPKAKPAGSAGADAWQRALRGIPEPVEPPKPVEPVLTLAEMGITLKPRVTQVHHPADSIAKSPSFTASQLADLRRGVLRLLDTLESHQQEAQESLAARIQRLARVKVIPHTVASCMHTIRTMRNDKEYGAKTISQAEAHAVAGALGVIKEWARQSDLTLPDELSKVPPLE
jgi:hypothetical protein